MSDRTTKEKGTDMMNHTDALNLADSFIVDYIVYREAFIFDVLSGYYERATKQLDRCETAYRALDHMYNECDADVQRYVEGKMVKLEAHDGDDFAMALDMWYDFTGGYMA